MMQKILPHTTNHCCTLVPVLSSFLSLKQHFVDPLSFSLELRASGSDKDLGETVLGWIRTCRVHRELCQNLDLKELCVCMVARVTMPTFQLGKGRQCITGITD